MSTVLSIWATLMLKQHSWMGHVLTAKACPWERCGCDSRTSSRGLGGKHHLEELSEAPVQSLHAMAIQQVYQAKDLYEGSPDPALWAT